MQLFLFCFSSVIFSLVCFILLYLHSFWLISLIYYTIYISFSGAGFFLCTCLYVLLLFHFFCFHCFALPYSCLHHTSHIEVVGRKRMKKKQQQQRNSDEMKREIPNTLVKMKGMLVVVLNVPLKSIYRDFVCTRTYSHTLTHILNLKT